MIDTNAKQWFNLLKILSIFQSNSQILDTKKGPLLGKFNPETRDQILKDENSISEEIQAYLNDRYNDSPYPLNDQAHRIQVTAEEIYEVITRIKGGKALSVDCMPDFFSATRFILDNFKTDAWLQRRV